MTINVENEANQAGLSPEQQTTIDQALTFLKQQGYGGTSELFSVDGAGYVRDQVDGYVRFGRIGGGR